MYDKETAWCGGFKAACEEYYKHIAIVDATNLSVLQSIFKKEKIDSYQNPSLKTFFNGIKKRSIRRKSSVTISAVAFISCEAGSSFP